MANFMLPIFDPTKPNPSFKDVSTLLELNDAKKIEVELPGDLYYLYAHQPKVTDTFGLDSKQNNVLNNNLGARPYN
jgi:hypothetical protein